MVEGLEIGRVERVELREVDLPLVAPFVSAAGPRAVRDILLVRVDGEDATGWSSAWSATLDSLAWGGVNPPASSRQLRASGLVASVG